MAFPRPLGGLIDTVPRRVNQCDERKHDRLLEQTSYVLEVYFRAVSCLSAAGSTEHCAGGMRVSQFAKAVASVWLVLLLLALWEIFAKASPTVFSPGQCRPPAVRCRLSKVELAERVEHALESVGLAGQGDIYPWQMSGGMQQRVAIARALVVEPKVMLMDEPFAAVDAQTWADLEDLVLTVRNEYKVTVAFVTHDIDEAVYLGDRVLVLAAGPGRMIADIPVALGTPRHQVETKLDPRFAELRSQVYQLVMRPSSQRPTAEAKQ